LLIVKANRNPFPVDYGLCNMTVTVYHDGGDGTYTRVVYRNAFLEHRKVQNIDRTGSQQVNSFLLVLPCSEQLVYVGDKVMRGEGPEISTREAWAAFVPAKVPGLVIVRSVDLKYWRDRLVHLEAAG